MPTAWTRRRGRAKAMKIGVIGGGSTYTPELVDGIIRLGQSLPIERISLMDCDESRLEVVGGLARRMVSAAHCQTAVDLTTNRVEAITNSDYVLTQIRVGGVEARIRDEEISVRHGVIGQETTGPGGFANAMRTIPVMLDIAAEVGRLAPRARLINFTNPSGIVTEALAKHSDVAVIGLCNGPIWAQRAIADLMHVSPELVRVEWIGLNHLSWIPGVSCEGRDVTDDVIERAIECRLLPQFEPGLLRSLRMLPSYYLDYYYNTTRVLEGQRSSGRTRGVEVREIERRLLEAYANPRLDGKPPELEQRGGAHYSTAAMSLIRALECDGDTQIVNVQNRGAIAELAEDVVVEVPCSISEAGARPLPCRSLPLSIRGLVQAVKAYEELTIEAAVEGSDEAAILALNAHPLVPTFDTAQHLWRELRRAHAQHLPQFK